MFATELPVREPPFATELPVRDAASLPAGEAGIPAPLILVMTVRRLSRSDLDPMIAVICETTKRLTSSPSIATIRSPGRTRPCTGLDVRTSETTVPRPSDRFARMTPSFPRGAMTVALVRWDGDGVVLPPARGGGGGGNATAAPLDPDEKSLGVGDLTASLSAFPSIESCVSSRSRSFATLRLSWDICDICEARDRRLPRLEARLPRLPTLRSELLRLLLGCWPLRLDPPDLVDLCDREDLRDPPDLFDLFDRDERPDRLEAFDRPERDSRSHDDARGPRVSATASKSHGFSMPTSDPSSDADEEGASSPSSPPRPGSSEGTGSVVLDSRSSSTTGTPPGFGVEIGSAVGDNASASGGTAVEGDVFAGLDGEDALPPFPSIPLDAHTSRWLNAISAATPATARRFTPKSDGFAECWPRDETATSLLAFTSSNSTAGWWCRTTAGEADRARGAAVCGRSPRGAGASFGREADDDDEEPAADEGPGCFAGDMSM